MAHMDGGAPLEDRRRRVVRQRTTAAFIAAIASSAGAIGLTGVDTTLCVLGLGECQITEARRSELQLLVEDVLVAADPVWSELFAEAGLPPFQRPRAILMDQDEESACGPIPVEITPVYCLRDGTIFIELASFNRLVREVQRDEDATYEAIGDTFPSFIVAHEVSHHVQSQTGDFAIFQERHDAAVGAEAQNAESRRLELQADCLAGVAAARAGQSAYQFDEQTIQEAIDTADALGDDTRMLALIGIVQEAAFTHGSAEQRLRWMTVGFTSGDMTACDTWSVAVDDL